MASTTFRKATSFLKLLNPCSLSPFQTQELLGFHPSRFFPTQKLRFSTTHQHYSSTRSSKNLTTTVSFPNRRMIHDDNSSRQAISEKVQQLQVYEFNERDRGQSQNPENSFGDLVPFSNKIYSANLKKEIGITAGTRILIQHEKDRDCRYEAVYSFYFDDYGHISVQGAHLTHKNTDLAVTGGSGNFKGVTGNVLLHPFVFPFKMFYTFNLGPGIPELPPWLTVKPRNPSQCIEPEC